jgi:hypothetical protein
MPRQAPTQSGHFSESEIDHFVMAITSAEAMVRHTALIAGRSRNFNIDHDVK